jgi:hypothetical protein
MKKLLSRNFAILIMIVLVSSPLVILPAFAEDIQTTAYCSVQPSPTGAGQTANIFGWIMPAPPAGSVYHNCFFGITSPSAVYQEFGPLSTDPTGLVYMNYTFTQVGVYTIDFWMENEVIGNDTYLGDSASWDTGLPLIVNVFPPSAIINVGQSQTFNSTVLGGVPPYSYYWYLDGNVVLGATDATWTYAPSVADLGFHSVSVLAVDSESLFAFSDSANVTVNNPLAGLVVRNVVDLAPSLDWSYLLTANGTVVEEFTLPSNGSISFPGLDPGTYVLAQTTKYGYICTSTTVDTVEVPQTTMENSTSITLNLFSSEAVSSVVFNNALIPEASFVKPVKNDDTSPPETSTYSIPNRKAIPVQAPWDPDIEDDYRIDLVKGKPTTILVDLLDVLTENGGDVELSDFVQVSLTSATGNLFSSPLVSNVLTGQEIKDNSIIFFSLNPPSVVGDDTITCSIRYGAAQPLSTLINPQETTDVSVKETSELSLYYSHLSRIDSYGTESASAFDDMVTNTADFIEAVYPVSGVTVDSDSTGLAGETEQPNYLGILKDCQNIAQQAKLNFPDSPYAIGVAIGPDLQSGGNYDNYFAYHGAVKGKKTAVGVSFGPGVRGVVVLDGYYSAAAHEIGHTFGLYYGEPEQYTLYDPGAPANGFRPDQNEWRNGYDFMGLSPFQSTSSVWVNTDFTFEPIFGSLKTPGDPGIILVNGIIYDNGTVELPLTWYSFPSGTPDTVPDGRFALRFINASDMVVGMTSFEAEFFLHVDPGVLVGEDLQRDYSGFGAIPVNFAGFAFATEYPDGTVTIELLDTTKPDGEQVIKTIYADDVESAEGGGATIESCDSTGTNKDTFDIADDLYVTGNGYMPSTTYDLFIVEDQAVWSDGMAIPTRDSGTATTVTSDAAGNVIATLVWSSPLDPGKYDIVVDVNGNGIYDEGIDALDDSDIQVSAGFFVIPEIPLGTLMASLTMITALVYRVTIPKIRKKLKGGESKK